MIFYFSGTGNSKWIAKMLSEKQEELLLNIADEPAGSETLCYTLRDHEKVGFVFPVYSWGPPAIVLNFIKRISFSNYNGQYLFFVCSCGDDIGLTRNVLEKAFENKPWKWDSGFSVIMPNNYVLMTGFNTDPRGVEKKKLADAKVSVNRIIEITGESRRGVFLCKEGRFPYLKTKIINPLFNKYAVSDKAFWVADNCISCGKCEKVCPMHNITMDGIPVWNGNCVSCLACYHICPRNAVQYGRKTKGKGQYFNPDIKNSSI